MDKILLKKKIQPRFLKSALDLEIAEENETNENAAQPQRQVVQERDHVGHTALFAYRPP